MESGTPVTMKLSRLMWTGREFLSPDVKMFEDCRNGVQRQIVPSCKVSVERARAWTLNEGKSCTQYPPFDVRRSISTIGVEEEVSDNAVDRA